MMRVEEEFNSGAGDLLFLSSRTNLTTADPRREKARARDDSIFKTNDR
jgi:hypothetical protein